MPGLGGLELLKRFPNIPFIMISGFATVPEAVEAMKIGAYDFVVKPFSYRELIPLVEAGLIPHWRCEEIGSRRARRFCHRPSAHARAAGIHPPGSQVSCFDSDPRRKRHRQRTFWRATFILIAGAKRALCRGQLRGAARRVCWSRSCSATSAALLPARWCSKPGKFELAHGGTLLLGRNQRDAAAAAGEASARAPGAGSRSGRRQEAAAHRYPRHFHDQSRFARNDPRRQFREDLFYRFNVVSGCAFFRCASASMISTPGTLLFHQATAIRSDRSRPAALGSTQKLIPGAAMCASFSTCWNERRSSPKAAPSNQSICCSKMRLGNGSDIPQCEAAGPIPRRRAVHYRIASLAEPERRAPDARCARWRNN